MQGELFVVSAPSGTGKTSLVRAFFANHKAIAKNLRFSVSHTNRAPRSGELHGRDYFFVSEEEFRRLIDEDSFLEWAMVYGQYKGTSRGAVTELRAQGFDVLLDIDVQGALQVKKRLPEAHLIFILPPSYQELERRLRERESDGPEQIERRLRVAADEVATLPSYDYVIVNEDLVAATDALAAIFLARRHLASRMEAATRQVLASFPATLPRTL